MALARGSSEEREPFAGGVQSVGYTRLKIGEAGRVVIPAEMRAAMGVKPGDVVTAEVVDGELRLLSRDAAIRKAQAIVREYVPAGVSLVDELISDRREEARRDTER
jgi:AbrB family looped-hinge helix DNA binding protein